jgi:sorbitol-6-phosphate 2-dehydrogenase
VAGVLDGRIALVTGAAQGLGRAIAERLAREGADVVLADIAEQLVSQTAAEIAAASGRRALAVKTDIADEAQVEALFRRTIESFGRLDICVANAGILISGAAQDFPVEKWRKVIEVNLVGYFLTARHAARVMLPRKRGVIIQINSKSGKKGSFRNSAYAAGKFGGIGLTQSLALEFAEHGVRVNAVCPGNLLDSPLWKDSLFQQYAQNQGISEEEVRRKYVEQVPMRRPCVYEDVCNVVVFLASDQSSYMTGQAINVTGGQEMR